MLREKTVCFSGHRPHKLITGGILSDNVLPMIKSMLYSEIEQAVKDGYENFISGMAQGVDLWAAMYVLVLRRTHPNIKLICAVPYEGQIQGLKGEDLYDYSSIIKCSDKVLVLSKNYYDGCFLKRNCFMVDNSSRLIAVVNNYRSGTGQTIRYAQKKGIDVRIIDAKKFCEAQKAVGYTNDPTILELD